MGIALGGICDDLIAILSPVDFKGFHWYNSIIRSPGQDPKRLISVIPVALFLYML
jgi:hypothetical protein